MLNSRSQHNTNILIIDDDPQLVTQYDDALKEYPCNIDIADSGEKAIACINATPPDLVILEINLNDRTGNRIFNKLIKIDSNPQIIVTNSKHSLSIATSVLRQGALDYIEKPISQRRLKDTVSEALSRQSINSALNRYQSRIYRGGYGSFIGESPAMRKIYLLIKSASTTKASVFITGESGTGKEVCAEMIHRLSQRSENRIVALNCAAIPKDLIESEVFGHVKGAFTGAVANRDGAASAAHDGTLFLDEIGEMNMDLQSKLLRFIQLQKFQKVGSTNLEEVDVRFISATNRDPIQQIREGLFREDLYYRLNVINVHLPPLRERGKDILLLANRFLMEYTKQENKQFEKFTPEAENLLLAYYWPGNIRELQNVILNIVVLQNGTRVLPSMLPPSLLEALDPKSTFYQSIPKPIEHLDDCDDYNLESGSVTMTVNDIISLADIEHQAIEKAIALCDGNIVQAAKHLGVSPSTLYRKRNDKS